MVPFKQAVAFVPALLHVMVSFGALKGVARRVADDLNNTVVGGSLPLQLLLMFRKDSPQQTLAGLGKLTALRPALDAPAQQYFDLRIGAEVHRSVTPPIVEAGLSQSLGN